MVVTCENCSARYKLDDARISGRGAKITCPRCRHVFVVHKSAPAAASLGTPLGQAIVGSNAPVDDDSATTVFSAEGPPAPEEAAPAPVIDVDTLDFRKVGVQAWKVKVKIGLVYDFSDYRTLARYIAEGRVTPSDKLSHDGKEWVEISQISDLAGHFIAVYQKLDAVLNAKPAETEEEFEDDEPTNIMGMNGEIVEPPPSKPVSLNSFASSAAPRILPPSRGPSGSVGMDLDSDLGMAMNAAMAAEEGPSKPKTVGPTFVDPFENKRKSSGGGGKRSAAGPASSAAPSKPKASRPSGKPPEQKSGGIPAWLPVVVLAVVGGAGAWWFTNQDAPPPPAPVVQTPSRPIGPSAEEVRTSITQELGSAEPVEDDSEPVESFVPEGEEPEQVLIPVGPDGKRGTKASTPGAASSSARTGRDYASDGDAAMRRGDYRAATTAYTKAVSMEPSNGVYNGHLGEAMVRAGDSSGAMSPLMNAASAGYAPAFKELGNIAAARGDKAGAIGYYQSYLATSPRDAASVQATIDKLSGS